MEFLYRFGCHAKFFRRRPESLAPAPTMLVHHHYHCFAPFEATLSPSCAPFPQRVHHLQCPCFSVKVATLSWAFAAGDGPPARAPFKINSAASKSSRGIGLSGKHERSSRFPRSV
jgi:hypothetical protein